MEKTTTTTTTTTTTATTTTTTTAGLFRTVLSGADVAHDPRLCLGPSAPLLGLRDGPLGRLKGGHASFGLARSASTGHTYSTKLHPSSSVL